uniref:Uncharacterized protein n=1 Tax=Panthera leo TaxID=9689 RepID=A0A8C8XKX4_PANLE
MHVEDTIRFCPKEERESEQTSFRIKPPDKNRKGIFTSSSTSSLKRSPVDQNTGKKLMRIPQRILYLPNKISSETDLLSQMTLTKEQLCKTYLKLHCQVVR